MRPGRGTRSRRAALALMLAVVCWDAALMLGAQERQASKAGELADGRTYRNAALGMTMTLPGQWQMTVGVQAEPGANSAEPGCQGPVCGKPQINVTLQSTTNASQRISFIAYQLAAPYLDRARYPLEQFAQVMTTGSLGGSGWIPNGELTAVRLGGRPGYRLLVTRGSPASSGLGYVGESNGYVFLLVGLATTDAGSLQAAIEGMALGK